jgi:hypothetical protein
MRILLTAIVVFLVLASSQARAQFIPPPPRPPVLPPNFQQQQQVRPGLGSRCATQFGICMMGAPGQVGTVCTCPTVQGLAPGQIVQ